MQTLLLSIDEAAKALSIGKTKLYAELKAGNIVGVKIGKRTFISAKNLDLYIGSLEAYSSSRRVN